MLRVDLDANESIAYYSSMVDYVLRTGCVYSFAITYCQEHVAGHSTSIGGACWKKVLTWQYNYVSIVSSNSRLDIVVVVAVVVIHSTYRSSGEICIVSCCLFGVTFRTVRYSFWALDTTVRTLIVTLSLISPRAYGVRVYVLARERLLKLSTGTSLCMPDQSHIWLIQHQSGSV